MTAPKVIYLQDDGDFDAAHEVTWCHHKVGDCDTRYIRADATELVALVDAAISADNFMRGDKAYERSGYGPKLRAALAAWKALK